ncbi:g8405 [Coccomyxa viridis]|uniref:G8405 protein n=1 Tax=Coccomyxa viridis TaxID=1274662 RepID=A0ABP1G1C4_9CHLO
MAQFLANMRCSKGSQDVSRIEPRYLLGIKSAEYSGTFVVNPHPTEGFARAPAGIHIVIPTVGRKCIFKLLESLEPQLNSQDSVTVGFDGQDREGIFDEVQAMLQRVPGQNEAIMESAYGDMGNSIREKHKARRGDFVMFADDDNWYTPDALAMVRAVVHNDRDALYVFQLQFVEGSENDKLPNMVENGEIEYGNIDTGCGVVPVKHVHLSDWFQDGYGADGAFFHQLSERLPRTYMVPKVLFMYSGAHGG